MSQPGRDAPAQAADWRVGVDIGGTFTDLVGLDGAGRLRLAKAPTSRDYAGGVLACLEQADVPPASVDQLVHGSTIAINTVLQRQGALTGLLTTAGFRDVYEMGRGGRYQPYNLAYRRPPPLVPRHRRLEVPERMAPDGGVVQPLDRDGARAAIRELGALGVEAVAVCLLHAYANPAHELALGDLLAEELPGAYVVLSHRVLREFREYERTSTAAINAYLGPVVSRYLGRLREQLAARGFGGELWVMQSSGGRMSAAEAEALPAALMESGPMGGAIAAGRVGMALGERRVIAFDMGGTTAKACLVEDGEPSVTTTYYVGGRAQEMPLLLPVVDIVEVGAGGGSVAWLDEVGALKVGPRSAGAHPGPACYGQGGVEPTVTDANLVLGRLSATRFLGGAMPLDAERAAAALRTQVAEPLGLDLAEAAAGVLRIADATMALAVRAVTVERGVDPRDCALVAYGGAGPLHAVAVARELSIPRVVIPPLPGHFSAVGLLVADERHDYVRSWLAPLAAVAPAALAEAFAAMQASGAAVLEREGVPPARRLYRRTLDLRYRGQAHTLGVPLDDEPLDAAALAAARARFDAAHERAYGHAAPDEPVELLNLRLVALGQSRSAVLPSPPEEWDGHSRQPPETRSVGLEEGRPTRCPIYARGALRPGDRLEGPAVVEEAASTLLLYAGDRLRVADGGHLIVEVRAP
ncbi:MAG TPA: hydantoinase/oxoprolinase family protein [Chloroflexota bacterium]|nr:hydantoinase/oxoprolinase family protein [Chloroflexota bacterium]